MGADLSAPAGRSVDMEQTELLRSMGETPMLRKEKLNLWLARAVFWLIRSGDLAAAV
jgi:hypothetical protein